MTTAYRWIKCSTPDCDAKHSGFYALDFDFLANLPEGWTTDPARCPDCNAPEAEAETDEHPILVLPLASGGAFTAYCPRSMTPADWKAVQAVCGAMAGVERAP